MNFERVGSQPSPEPDSAPVDRAAVRVLLRKLTHGDQNPFDHVVPIVYDQQGMIAGQVCASGGRNGRAGPRRWLIEAYLRLAGTDGNRQDRADFFAVAAGVIRNNSGESYKGCKPGETRGGATHIPLDKAVMGGPLRHRPDRPGPIAATAGNARCAKS